MPPWTDRLLTKIRKLYVVRLLLPAEDTGPRQQQQQRQRRQQPEVVSARVYGFSRVSRRRPLVESSQSVESFSNSQSVPESSSGGGDNDNSVDDAAAAAAAHAAADTPLSAARSGADSCVSLQRSSSTGGSSSVSSGTVEPDGSFRRRTPRLRISDSSRVTDANEIAILQQFIERHGGGGGGGGGGRRRQLRDGCQVLAFGRLQAAGKIAAEPAEPQAEQPKLPDETEVSVPASCPLPPRRRPLQASELKLLTLATGATRADKANRKQPPGENKDSGNSDDKESQPTEELLVAVFLNESGRPSTARSKAPRMRARATLNHHQRRESAPEAGGVTRTIAFSVAREDDRSSAATAATADRSRRRGGRQDVAVKRRLPPRSSRKPSSAVAATSASSTETAATSTTTTMTTTTTTASTPPGRQRRKLLQRRHQQQRRGGKASVGSVPFEPTFSKIVEWSEGTDISAETS